jgi:AcrR family transcriptional regulator
MLTDSTPQTSATRRWRRRKEARPGEILAAALELFVERGFSSTKLEDVARRAGVSKGTVYRYFESKQAIFRAVVQELVVPELARAEKRVDDYRGDHRKLIVDLIKSWWHAVGESHLSGIPKLLVAEAGNFPELADFFVDQVVRRLRRLVARVLAQGIAQGEFRPCNVEYTARALIAPMVFAAIWQRSLGPHDDGAFDARTYIDVYLDLYLNGLGADADQAKKSKSTTRGRHTMQPATRRRSQ